MNLKNFIISEENSVNHADRYLRFIERYSSLVLIDLKKQLTLEWEAAIKTLTHRHPTDASKVQDVQLRNPNACVALELVTSSEKLVTARSRTPIEVQPSVKIPLIYSIDERQLLTRALLTVAKEAMTDVVVKWREAFNYEHKGKIQPWFKIIQDVDELRLQLSTSSNAHEDYKTLYAVRTEFGKPSKLKDFDRIYLCSLC